MRRLRSEAARLCIVCAALCLVPASSHAWEPNDKDLAAAISAGNFTEYYANISKWLSQQTPASLEDINEDAMVAILKKPVVARTLYQRTLLAKYGVDKLGGFANIDESNKVFLTWLLGNAKAMNLYIEGNVPIGLAQREAGNWDLPFESLKIWKRIYDADPESKDGLYLRLAIATGLNPPGTGCRGSGQREPYEDPVVRYTYFKTAYKNGELFPSFENLTVFDYRQIVCSNARNEDLSWAREAINSWRPDFRVGEKVVDTTSQVWYRNSPLPHTSYKNVLAGGGKCGPRSSWAVMICQAYGIPATGVGQPAHACVAYRTITGEWTVAYGRSWAASKLLGLSGPDFVAGMEKRSRPVQFSNTEHLRWFAAALTSTEAKEQAEAVLTLARNIAKSTSTAHKILSTSERPDEAEVDMPQSTSMARLVPDKPAEATAELSLFEAPANLGEDYIARVRGFVHPRVAGQYVFAIACDDEGELFLSTDENPANKRRIAFAQSATNGREFSKLPGQKSALIRLEAGKKYYIEALHRQFKGGAHLSVAWTGEGEGMTTGVIPGENLSAYPSGAKGKILHELWRQPPKAEAPIQVAPGVIHVDAGECSSKGGKGGYGGPPGPAMVDSFTGGKQLCFPALAELAWAKFDVKAPKTGTYELVLRISTVNENQNCRVTVAGPDNDEGGPPIALPLTYGLWETIKPVEVTMKEGPQTVTISMPGQRGVALKWFELKLKEAKAE